MNETPTRVSQRRSRLRLAFGYQRLRNLWQQQDARAERNSLVLANWIEAEMKGGRVRFLLSLSVLLSFFTGCITNIGALGISLDFFFVARGESIRPMGWAAAEILFAAVAFLFGFLPGLFGIFGKRRAMAGLVYY
jgi:hypothetical protein